MNRKHGFFQAAMRNGTAGFAVLLLAAVFAVGGCDNGTTSDNDSTATYTGTNGGSTYTLTVTNGTAFVLTVGDKTSSGAAVKNGGTYTLTPTDATAFTLTVSGPGIIAISGTITFTDNSSDIVSITLTPPDGDSMKLVGKWLLSGGTGDYEGLTLDFRNNGTLITNSPNSANWNMTGSYTYSGTTLTVSDGGENSATGTATLSPEGILTLNGFDVTGAPLKDGTYTKQQ